MKEHGLIFTGDLVQKLLADEKWNTRRVFSRMNINVNGQGRCNQEYWDGYDFDDAFVDPGPSPMGNPGPYLKVFNNYCGARDRLYPVYRVGDLIWARETWGMPSLEMQKLNPDLLIVFKADSKDGVPFSLSDNWKSPLHLRKDLARIWLEITDVRIQRIQEIDIEDVVAEGLDPSRFYEHDPYDGDVTGYDEAWGIDQFADLWDDINKKRDFGWDKNPWVIAFTFKRIEK